MHILKKARRLSVVERWSIIPTLKRQTVAEHTFQVAMLARELVNFHQQIDGHFSSSFKEAVLDYALEHDIDEAIHGDAPGGPSKKKDFKQLVEKKGQVYAIVKLADLMEAAIYLNEETRMGNKQVEVITSGYMDNIEEVAKLVHWNLPLNRALAMIVKLLNESIGLDMGDFNE